MSRLRLAVAYAARHFSRPGRGNLWSCPTCGTANEPGNAKCMLGCGTRGPLAPSPRPAAESGS